MSIGNTDITSAHARRVPLSTPWDDRVTSWEDVATSPVFGRLAERVLSVADPQEPDVVVDMGAGTGLLALPAARRAHTVHAVDYSAPMLARLADRASARPATLSGGEQQRVAIARAVISQPEILVADEPTGNVDAEMASRLMNLFVALNRLGTTVVVATHDVGLIASTPGAQMVRLENGSMVDPTGSLRNPPPPIHPAPEGRG